MPKLEKWAVVNNSISPYIAPEMIRAQLTGIEYGHNRIPDGHFVITSVLEHISVKNRTAQTMNTPYELGEPDPKFVEYVDSIGKKLEDYEC
jgi:hypothetical protein